MGREIWDIKVRSTEINEITSILFSSFCLACWHGSTWKGGRRHYYARVYREIPGQWELRFKLIQKTGILQIKMNWKLPEWNEIVCVKMTESPFTFIKWVFPFLFFSEEAQQNLLLTGTTWRHHCIYPNWMKKKSMLEAFSLSV